jgi:hypothetical protein
VPAALRDQQALTGLGQVTNHFLGGGVDHRGTDRHRQDQIVAFFTGTVSAAAVGATLGIKVPGVTVVDQGVEVFVGLM